MFFFHSWEKRISLFCDTLVAIFCILQAALFQVVFSLPIFKSTKKLLPWNFYFVSTGAVLGGSYLFWEVSCQQNCSFFMFSILKGVAAKKDMESQCNSQMFTSSQMSIECESENLGVCQRIFDSDTEISWVRLRPHKHRNACISAINLAR